MHDVQCEEKTQKKADGPFRGLILFLRKIKLTIMMIQGRAASALAFKQACHISCLFSVLGCKTLNIGPPRLWVARFAVLRPALCGIIPHFCSTLGKPYFLCWALSIFFKSQVFVLEMHNKHVVFSNKGTYYTKSLIIFPATIELTRTVLYIFSSNSVVYMGWPSNQKCPTFPIV